MNYSFYIIYSFYRDLNKINKQIIEIKKEYIDKYLVNIHKLIEHDINNLEIESMVKNLFKNTEHLKKSKKNKLKHEHIDNLKKYYKAICTRKLLDRIVKLTNADDVEYMRSMVRQYVAEYTCDMMYDTSHIVRKNNSRKIEYKDLPNWKDRVKSITEYEEKNVKDAMDDNKRFQEILYYHREGKEFDVEEVKLTILSHLKDNEQILSKSL